MLLFINAFKKRYTVDSSLLKQLVNIIASGTQDRINNK